MTGLNDRQIVRANPVGGLVAIIGACAIVLAILVLAGQIAFWIEAGHWGAIKLWGIPITVAGVASGSALVIIGARICARKDQ